MDCFEICTYFSSCRIHDCKQDFDAAIEIPMEFTRMDCPKQIKGVLSTVSSSNSQDGVAETR